MRALVSDYLDRTLERRVALVLEAHLAFCPTCRRFAVTIKKTILLYRRSPVVDVPVAVRGHLRELLRQRHERAPRKAGRCRPGAVARTPPVARKTAPGNPARKP